MPGRLSPGGALHGRGIQTSHISTTSTVIRSAWVIMTIGMLPDASRTHTGHVPDALEPGIHCVRTHWIRGFMTFRRVRHARIVMLMVPVCPESGFLSEDGRYVMSRGADRSKRGKAEPCRCC